MPYPISGWTPAFSDVKIAHKGGLFCRSKPHPTRRRLTGMGRPRGLGGASARGRGWHSVILAYCCRNRTAKRHSTRTQPPRILAQISPGRSDSSSLSSSSRSCGRWSPLALPPGSGWRPDRARRPLEVGVREVLRCHREATRSNPEVGIT